LLKFRQTLPVEILNWRQGFPDQLEISNTTATAIPAKATN
jgi:hypothetical protein